MRSRRGRKTHGPSQPLKGQRYIRARLQDGGLGHPVPVVIYPRYSTLAGEPFPTPFDVSAYAKAAIGRAGSVTFRLVQSDDSGLGWDGRPPAREPGFGRRPLGAKSKKPVLRRPAGRRSSRSGRRKY